MRLRQCVDFSVKSLILRSKWVENSTAEEQNKSSMK